MLSHHLPTNPNLQSTQFSCLQLPNLQIKILDRVSPSYYFISQLYLDHNALITLNGIQRFHNLEVLSFNFNHVACFNQLNKIQNKFFMKFLAFIGNPLEADTRARFQVIVGMGFKSLEKLNPIGETRFARMSMAKPRKKQESIYLQYQQQQGKTQRYTPKFYQNQVESGRKLILKTQADQKIKQRLLHPTAHTYTKSNRINISTTVNKSQDSAVPSIKNASKPLKISQNQFHVDIRPFQYVDQDQQGSPERSSARKSQGQLQDESPIKSNRYKENSRSLFHETGYFDQSSRFIKNGQNMYKSFAMEFLQQQKIEIADAFRTRHIKEFVFTVLRQLKQIRWAEDTQAKRKALGAIKIYSLLQKIGAK